MSTLPACTPLRAQGGTDAASPQASTAAIRSAQIIVKFRDPGLDPSKPQLMDEIGRDAGARLVYVRPMSGGAHVLRPENAVDAVELDRIIANLGKRKDVEYAEPDRIMQHMRGTAQ